MNGSDVVSPRFADSTAANMVFARVCGSNLCGCLALPIISRQVVDFLDI
jgi:hypothetical protein